MKTKAKKKVAMLWRLLEFVPLSLLLVGCMSQSPQESSISPYPPKVILIIGDGMDDQQITIARTYLVGSAGRMSMDSLPYRGAVQIQAVVEDDPSIPLYVSDSANTATSMATGGVTSPSRIASTAGTDQTLVTIMELAINSGMQSGIVTTAALTDATPASFVTHVNQRTCQGPENMVGIQRLASRGVATNCSQYLKKNGGPGSISEQLVASGVDVLLGGGSQYFDQASEQDPRITVADEAVANGYQLVRNYEDLMASDPNSKLLGLFATGTLPVRWQGEGNAAAVQIEKLAGVVQLPDPFACEANPAFEGIPGLASMTKVALDRFDPANSFILMIESASIDKQSHARRPCGSIGEIEQLNEALDVAMEYAQRHPETLILVTADHSHAAQLSSPDGSFLSQNYASPGHFARVRTPEGGLMGVNYATNDSPIIEYHTGAQIPIYGYGAEVGSLPTFLLQKEIFGIMARKLGLEEQSILGQP